MTPTIPATPAGFRSHALDGAMLYFQPRSGLHIRLRNAATRPCQRQAPRVVMFGLTNVCNLRCGFCSRDAQAPSLWTQESAYQTLRDLAAAGVLEVAFGGGEPLLFKGFATLVQRLHADTPLALNLTTNGHRVSDALWQALQGGIRMARLSIYPDTDYARIAQVWQRHGQRWGANVLVDDAALPTLPALLHRLAELGAADVSLLTYVGEPQRLLGLAGRRQLQAIARQAPLPCRLSVCAGDMGLPALSSGFTQGDCGAGRDFIAVTPDQRVHACSFAAASWPARNAADVLHAWRARQAALRQPSPRSGCARHDAPAPMPAPTPMPEPEDEASVHIWQAFSGNNSGECVMVAQFETPEKARAFADLLLPGWQPDEPWSEEWLHLLEQAQIARPACNERGRTYIDMPEQLAAIARSVVALRYGLGDDLQELTHLAWRHQAQAVDGITHAHTDVRLLALAHCASPAQAQAIAAQLQALPGVHAWPRQRHLLALAVIGEADNPEENLHARKTQFEAALHGLRWVADVTDASPDDWQDALKHYRPNASRQPRLCVHFWGKRAMQKGQALAQRLQALAPLIWHNQQTSIPSLKLLLPAGERPRHLAVLALRAGAHVTWLYGSTLRLRVYLAPPESPPQKGRRQPKPKPDVPAFLERLHACGLPPGSFELIQQEAWGGGSVYLHFATDAPQALIPAAQAVAAQAGIACAIYCTDMQPLHWQYDKLLRALAPGKH